MADTAGMTMSMTGTAGESTSQPTERPQLILALECSRPTALSARYDLARVSAVTFGRGKARGAERTGPGDDGSKIDAAELDIRVPDRWMSSRHARIDRSFGRWVLIDTESKNGTLVNGEATRRAVLRDGDLFELGHTLFLFRDKMLIAEDDPLDVDLAEQNPAPGFGTLVPDFARQLGKLRQIAAAEISVLLEGESGTGKEVVARAVHALSGRPGNFVAVNCGAISKNLVESELFGHRKGAFSGASDDRPGLVRSADRGTLFLDEIGDLPAGSQAALLRVLQEREVLPVGGTKTIPVDLRVVAATHRDLDTLVGNGEFRRDLFARLAGFRLRLPSLRQRREDLGLLIGVLLRRITGNDSHPGLDCDAARRLFDHDWPLNIRELEQTLATAVVLAQDAPIGRDHLPESISRARASSDPASTLSSTGTNQTTLSPEDDRRRDALLALLREHHGNVSAIARAMGKDRKQIQRWLKRFGLDANEFRQR